MKKASINLVQLFCFIFFPLVINAATFTVINLNDSGIGSLRQAILDANNTAGNDVINFQSGLTGTITLTTGNLLINSNITINGPGANILSINGNNIGRIFGINSGGHTVVITGLRLFGGNPGFDGGAIINSGGLLTLNNMIIEGNRAGSFNTQYGGGIYSWGEGNSLTINNSSILNNTAPIGGGVYSKDGPVSLNNVNISNNSASFSNGGLRVSGGELRITGGSISNNTTDHFAGGIEFGGGGKITLTSVTVSNNRATGSESRGGGIILQGELEMTNCIVSGNSAGFGGGMYFYIGTGIIKGTTFSHNTAATGGGLYIGLSGTFETGLTMVNSTISGNTSTAFQGGGIYNHASAKTTLRNVTVAANTSTNNDGGGIYNIGSLTMANTIVADNTASSNPDLSGTFASLGNNLIRNRGSSSGYIATDLPNASDPKLDILKNNGGPTETHALLTGSAAIDKGNNAQALDTDNATPLTTDQRGIGYPRIINGDSDGVAIVDIGAYEHPQACTYTLNPNNLVVPSGGGSYSLNITTQEGCTWTAAFIAQNVFPVNLTFTSPTSGTGSGRVDFTISPNSSGSGLTKAGSISVNGSTLQINQDVSCGSTYINPASANIPREGVAQSSFFAGSNTPYCLVIPQSNDPWITVIGRGNDTAINYSVAPNNGPVRTGTISIIVSSPLNTYQNTSLFTVNQDGQTNCTYFLSPQSVQVSPAGAGDGFNIATASGCEWAASSNATWITITSGALGTGTGRVNYSVQANSGQARSGTITAGGQPFSIFQPAAAPQIDLITGSGRVVSNDGKSARGALLTFTNQTTGEKQIVITNQFGYFHLTVQRGQNYGVGISHKRYKFTGTRFVSYFSSALSVIFTADPE